MFFSLISAKVNQLIRVLFGSLRLITHQLLVSGWCLTLLTTACTNDSVTTQPGADQLRQKAKDFYQALYNPAQASVDSYVAADYREHQIGARFTLDGLKSYAQNRTRTVANHRLVILRTLVQGNLVGLHLEEKVAADSSVARMALLRFNENGQIVDHWEALQGQPRQRANPNTMFDGAAVNYQSRVGGQNRDAIVAADGRIFNQYDTLAVRQFHDPSYIQHNPFTPNGPDALIYLLNLLRTQGIRTTATGYQKLAEGDFVMQLTNYQTTPAFPIFTDTIGFDLIRMTDTGKAVEHWDVIQELNGADKSKVF